MWSCLMDRGDPAAPLLSIVPGGAVTPRTCAQNDPNIVPSTITTTSATIEPSTAVTAMSP